MTKQQDRVSQLQECVDKLSELFFISVGALQRDAPLLETSPEIPVTAWTKEQVQNNWKGNQELAKTVARDIVHTAKIIDFLIDSLPGISMDKDQQMAELERLETENRTAETNLQVAIKKGEAMYIELGLKMDKIIKDQSMINEKNETQD